MVNVDAKNAGEAGRTVKDTPVCSPGTVRRSTTIQQFAAAMVKVQAQIEDPTKNKRADAGGRGSYRYADLPTVLDVVRPALVANGFAVMQFPCELDGSAALTTQLIHQSGEWVETTALLRPVKSDPQAVGSALTYARRYALLALCGIAADDDDDGKAASQPARRVETQQAQRQPEQQEQRQEKPVVKYAARDNDDARDKHIAAFDGCGTHDAFLAARRAFNADLEAVRLSERDYKAICTAGQRAKDRIPQPAKA